MTPNPEYRLRRSGAALLLLLCACGSASKAPNAEAPTGLAGPVVRAELGAAPSTASGGKGEVTVTLVIHSDFHIMSNQPSKPEYKATSVAIADAPDVTFGEPVFPPPVTFRYSQDEIRTFVGRTVVRVPFRVAEGAAAGPRTAHGVVRYQACTATACMIPESVAFDVPLVVAGRS